MADKNGIIVVDRLLLVRDSLERSLALVKTEFENSSSSETYRLTYIERLSVLVHDTMLYEDALRKMSISVY